jgi:hypothetical protein
MKMENGRFATIIVIVALLIGGLAYYENTRTAALNSRIDIVQSKAENAELTADQAKATANEAKSVLASLTAGNAKAGDIGQLVKQATDAAAAASKSADEAKQASEDLSAERARLARRR